MAPWKLFSTEVSTFFKTFYGSWSHLIIIIFYLILIVVPFLILFRIGNIWPIDSDYEQPSVVFTGMFSVTMVTSRNGSDVIIYTSTRTSDMFRPSSFRIPTVTLQEYDDNNDGLKDRLQFNLNMPISANESIYDIDLIMIFNCTLQRYGRTFESFARMQSSNNLSRMTSLKVVGNMKLVQLELLKGSKSYWGLRQKTNDKPCSTLLVNASVFEVISCYVDSQVFLALTDVKYSWQPVRLEDGNFVLKANIIYSTMQTLMYEPYHWFSAKWFYIQWMGICIIVYVIGRSILTYLFVTRLMDAIPDDEEVKEKLN